jgi:pantothenate kinase-related protein Tda10
MKSLLDRAEKDIRNKAAVEYSSIQQKISSLANLQDSTINSIEEWKEKYTANIE